MVAHTRSSAPQPIADDRGQRAQVTCGPAPEQLNRAAQREVRELREQPGRSPKDRWRSQRTSCLSDTNQQVTVHIRVYAPFEPPAAPQPPAPALSRQRGRLDPEAHAGLPAGQPAWVAAAAGGPRPATDLRRRRAGPVRVDGPVCAGVLAVASAPVGAGAGTGGATGSAVEPAWQQPPSVLSQPAEHASWPTSIDGCTTSGRGAGFSHRPGIGAGTSSAGRRASSRRQAVGRDGRHDRGNQP